MAVKHAKNLWGPQVGFPNNKPKGWSGGKWLDDVLGGAWWKTFTLPHTAPKSSLPGFATGGHIMSDTVFPAFRAGEGGHAERITIAPLSRDMPTPHEKRMEQFARQDQQLLERLVTAVENADGDVFIDGKVLLGFVGRGQRGETRREMVAAGRATKWRQ